MYTLFCLPIDIEPKDASNTKRTVKWGQLVTYIKCIIFESHLIVFYMYYLRRPQTVINIQYNIAIQMLGTPIIVGRYRCYISNVY